jgi:hypothetical protein
MKIARVQWRIAASFCPFLLALVAEPVRAQTSAAQEAEKLHALFDEDWQWTLREYPEFATRVGDPRFNDKLTDLSAAAMESRKTHTREVLERIRSIDRARLAGQDVLSYDLFRRTAEERVAFERFPAGMIPLGGFLSPYEWMPVCQMGGVHITIPELPRLAPLHTAMSGRSRHRNGFAAARMEYARWPSLTVRMIRAEMGSRPASASRAGFLCGTIGFARARRARALDAQRHNLLDPTGRDRATARDHNGAGR